MSEYQYYEFLALDRPLGAREQRELRAISSRATITGTRFANWYTYGNLKAHPADLVDRYFDAHLYLANWGTRALTFRFPRRLLPVDAARRYCAGGAASARLKGEHVVVDFCSEDEPADWVEEDEGTGRLAPLLPLRADLASGDHRALYLGWLLRAQSGELGDADEEPPCPPGLRSPSAPLAAMIDFLRIDPDLVDAAATGSADASGPTRSVIGGWLASLPSAERSALLVAFVEGGDPHLRSDVLRRIRAADGAGQPGKPTRTVGQLLAEAGSLRERRERREAERVRRERERQEREAGEARERELDALACREERAWVEVDAHVATKQPRRYDEAAKLLRDLRDLGRRRGDAVIEARIERLCAEHERKPAFVRRVREALADR